MIVADFDFTDFTSDLVPYSARKGKEGSKSKNGEKEGPDLTSEMLHSQHQFSYFSKSVDTALVHK